MARLGRNEPAQNGTLPATLSTARGDFAPHTHKFPDGGTLLVLRDVSDQQRKEEDYQRQIAVLKAELAQAQHAVREMAEKIALVPALTAQMVKASINHMIDLMGQRESWRYHFMLHQFVSNTPTALERVEARKEGGMDAVKKEQGGA